MYVLCLQIFVPLMLREIRGQSPAAAQTICHGDLNCVVMVISIEPEHCVRVRTYRSSASVTVCRYIGILGSRYNRYLCLLQQEAGVTTCRACLVWLNQTSSAAAVHTAHVTMQRLQLTRKTIKCSSECGTLYAKDAVTQYTQPEGSPIEFNITSSNLAL